MELDGERMVVGPGGAVLIPPGGATRGGRGGGAGHPHFITPTSGMQAWGGGSPDGDRPSFRKCRATWHAGIGLAGGKGGAISLMLVSASFRLMPTQRDGQGMSSP